MNNLEAPFVIKVKYHSDIDHLKQIKIGEAIDVRAAEDVYLNLLEYHEIPLGFSCKVPDGYFPILMPRSSTFKKYGIIEVNSVGLIDSSFCGNNDQWAMPVVSLRSDVHIPKNERIGQFVIVKKLTETKNVEFQTVDDLESEDRGGLGSTGRL